MPHSVPAGPPLRPGERRSTSWAGFSGGRTRGPARPVLSREGGRSAVSGWSRRRRRSHVPRARRTCRGPRRASDSCPAGVSWPARGAAERSSWPCERHGRRAGTRCGNERRSSPPARRSPGSSASPAPAEPPNRCLATGGAPSMFSCRRPRSRRATPPPHRGRRRRSEARARDGETAGVSERCRARSPLR